MGLGPIGFERLEKSELVLPQAMLAVRRVVHADAAWPAGAAGIEHPTRSRSAAPQQRAVQSDGLPIISVSH